jgi:hypothetical protein
MYRTADLTPPEPRQRRIEQDHERALILPVRRVTQKLKPPRVHSRTPPPLFREKRTPLPPSVHNEH